MNTTLAVIVALAAGFLLGAYISMEIGRVIYNRKMDEIRCKAEEMRELIGLLPPVPSGYITHVESDTPPAGWKWFDQERGLVQKL